MILTGKANHLLSYFGISIKIGELFLEKHSPLVK